MFDIVHVLNLHRRALQIYNGIKLRSLTPLYVINRKRYTLITKQIITVNTVAKLLIN